MSSSIACALADFRHAFPIGLTLESLSPHTALCRASEGIAPLIGRYGFMMMAAEDLLVLARALPAREDLVRYLDFRQADTIRNHEAAHLTAFLERKPDPVVSDVEDIAVADVVMPQPQNENVAQAEVIEAPAAEGIEVAAPEIVAEEIIAQETEQEIEPESDEGIDDGIARPSEIAHLLNALHAAREPGWRAAHDAIRMRGPAELAHLATMLRQAGESLATQEFRWLHVADAPPLFIYLQRFGTRADVAAVAARESRRRVGGLRDDHGDPRACEFGERVLARDCRDGRCSGARQRRIRAVSGIRECGTRERETPICRDAAASRARPQRAVLVRKRKEVQALPRKRVSDKTPHPTTAANSASS